MTNGLNIDQDAFRMALSVPENMVGIPVDGDWAAWQGLTSTQVGGRDAVVLVSISVTAFQPGKPAGDDLAARLRDRHAEGGACIEQFATEDGNPGVSVRRIVTQQVNGRDVTTGQAQALVVYPGAGALGVVSGIALDPADLGRAADLVTGIATGMTVTGAPAAALPTARRRPRRRRQGAQVSARSR